MNGGVQILVSVVLNQLGLIVLRKLSGGPKHGLVIVAFAYLWVIFGMSILRRKDLLKEVSSFFSLQSHIFAFIWSAGCGLLYYLFLFYPQFTSITQVVVASSLAPLLSVGIIHVLKVGSPNARGTSWVNAFCMLSILGVIAYRSGVKNGFGNLVAFVLVILAFVATQVSSRAVAWRGRVCGDLVLSNFWIFFGVIVLLGLTSDGSVSIPESGLISPQTILASFVLGIFLIFIQVLFARGVSKVGTVTGALASSSSVPLSMLVSHFAIGSALTFVDLSLGILYVTCISLMTKYEVKV